MAAKSAVIVFNEAMWKTVWFENIATFCYCHCSTIKFISKYQPWYLQTAVIDINVDLALKPVGIWLQNLN